MDRRLTWWHMEAPGTTDRHRGLITAPSDSQRRIRLTIAAHGIRLIAIVHPAGASSDGVGDAWKNTTIAVRSNHNRGAIEPRSWILPRGIYPTIIGRQFRSIWSTIDARSWSIVVDRAKIVAYFEASFWRKIEVNSPPIRRRIEATTYAHGMAPT